jgi:hypothetical protein
MAVILDLPVWELKTNMINMINIIVRVLIERVDDVQI